MGMQIDRRSLLAALALLLTGCEEDKGKVRRPPAPPARPKRQTLPKRAPLPDRPQAKPKESK